LYGVREDTGSFIEFLLLKRLEADMWEILARPGKKARVGQRFVFGEELTAEVVSVKDDGNRVVKFFYEGVFEELLDRLGTMPLPPYITEKLQNQERYQTVYSKQPGSAAAPTAGLHFTPELLEKIRQKGVKVVPVLLHVGLGTFRPVKVDDVAKHQMHSEFYSVSLEAAETINACRQNGGKVFCVGTTSCRTLESVTDEQGVVHAQSGETDIFIYPGYRFKAVDHLITNFHLPESTLLMLVSALCSREEILDIYKTAKKEQYRFFSFGDAMLILGRRNDE
ncbi:MAG: tRNA preQ1(34) S-adenosylmethionine ribosyltransferase-isomerase QueA, partial [Clostridia bacterium]|nr:tRNA preQ1(34) S-adenosylmethionine ribosyltransferase-isomerase QueA [Clostridia bacterium]